MATRPDDPPIAPEPSVSATKPAAPAKPKPAVKPVEPIERPKAFAASRIVATRFDYWRRTVDERRASRFEQATSDAERSAVYVSHCPPLICDKALEAAAIAHCETMAAEGRVFHSQSHGCLELVASWDHSEMAKFLEDDRKRTGEIDPVTRAMLNDATAVEQFAPLDRPEPGSGPKQDKDAKEWESAVTSEVYRLVGAGCYVAPNGTAYICVQIATGTER